MGSGPKKSMFNVCHGSCGIVEGCNGCGGSIFEFALHDIQGVISVSTFWSSLGKYTLSRSRFFVLLIPKCDSWANLIILLSSAGGTIVRFLSNRIEPSALIVNSSLNLLHISRSSLLHDLNCFVTSAIRNYSPDNINTLSALRVSSFLVCSFISSIETAIGAAYCETKFTYSSVMVDTIDLLSIIVRREQ